MRKLIVAVGVFVIIVVTVCTFKFNYVKYVYTRIHVNRNYKNIANNNYYYEDNFLYVNNYDGLLINSKEDLINSVYHLLNSGNTDINVYCGYHFDDCKKSIIEINQNNMLVSTLSNFVHPFNNFNNVTFSYDDYYEINIKINHLYSEEQIKEINNEVDKIIANNIKSNMTNKEKIKVIHDYLIENITYDTESLDKDIISTAYDALIRKRALCSGYTDAMAIFLDRFNIINYKIGNNEQHTWNYVYVNNEWLHLDVTWDDPINGEGRDTYFLIDTDELKELNDNNHEIDKNIYKET